MGQGREIDGPSFFSFFNVVTMKPLPDFRNTNPASTRFTRSELLEVAQACEALKVSRSTLLRRGALTVARELQATLPR